MKRQRKVNHDGDWVRLLTDTSRKAFSSILMLSAKFRDFIMRPTKYTEELLETARDYVVNYPDYDDVIPSIAGLSIALKISRETIHTWIKDPEKKVFSDIVRELNANQERALLNGGLSSTMNASISKLVLTKHGYTDRVEQDITSGGEKLEAPTYKIVDK